MDSAMVRRWGKMGWSGYGAGTYFPLVLIEVDDSLKVSKF
jgi:hypothetical protein